MAKALPTILALNGALRGSAGNTARLLAFAGRCVQGRATFDSVVLGDYAASTGQLIGQIGEADALLLGSGVYWNAYGSPMQRFLEVLTAWETHDVLLGKPVGVLLSMDSVGGPEVAARLLGVMNLLGCSVPPLAAVVISRLGLACGPDVDQEDVWQPADLEILMDNLLACARAPRPAWRRWTIRSAPQPIQRYPAPGLLDVDQPPWLKG